MWGSIERQALNVLHVSVAPGDVHTRGCGACVVARGAARQGLRERSDLGSTLCRYARHSASASHLAVTTSCILILSRSSPELALARLIQGPAYTKRR